MKYEFSDKAADLAVKFFHTKLRHVTGTGFAGKPFRLEDWQEKIVRDLFGWKRPDGTRRYRTAYIEIPRKNGKTTMAAGLALYLLLCDGEARAEVYSAAGDRGQARVCFEAARDMIASDARLSAEAEVYQNRIVSKRLKGFYTALSAEAYSKHGYNPHGIIFDEVHVQPDRQLWDVLRTGVGARRQPLTVAITTAGHDRSSICWELHQRAKSVIADPSVDESFYAVIYGAEPEEDWTDPAVWYKANPNLGKSITLEYMQEKCREAQDNPEAENTFRNLHLNQWTQQAVRWIPMHLWDKCQDDFTEADMLGRPCFAGLDMASTRDTNALTLVFPMDDGSYRVLPYFWIPEESQSDRAHQDRRQVLNWAAKGIIRTTPGPTTGYHEVADDLIELGSMFDIQLMGYDPWGPATPFVQILESKGFPLEKMLIYRQIIGNLTAPSKEFHRLVACGKLRHNGNPVLRWMAENVAAERDKNDNIRPDKAASADKIDGVVATIMALGLAMTNTIDNYKFEPGSLRL